MQNAVTHPTDAAQAGESIQFGRNIITQVLLAIIAAVFILIVIDITSGFLPIVLRIAIILAAATAIWFLWGFSLVEVNEKGIKIGRKARIPWENIIKAQDTQIRDIVKWYLPSIPTKRYLFIKYYRPDRPKKKAKTKIRKFLLANYRDLVQHVYDHVTE
ncbi:MAG TPA: hypothetical protein ENK14_07040 [Caldithrix sp.]|nr:hypothetical protein [Caldithrix sp.]